MKKKWLALPLALVMAGALVIGAGCGENKDPVVTVEDGYVYVDGKKTDVQASEPHDPVVTVEDGYVYVDGKKTDVKAGSGEAGSAFELWKKDNPSYEGTESEWLAWLQKLTEPQEDTVEYQIVENGAFRGMAVNGTATTQNGVLNLTDAILRLPESVVLPIGEDASWEVNITGTLLKSSATTGAQFLAGNPYTEYGRVYLGVNKNSKMFYIGVRLNTVYVNYGWEFSDTSFFSAEHSYKLSYANGSYSLVVDGEPKGGLKFVNFNQLNKRGIDDPQAGAEELNGLIRTVLAQDYIEMTNLGITEFAWNAEIENFSVTTSSAAGYKRMLSHPLANTRIFYLGSSITYGSATGGVAFGEIIHAVTGNPYRKEAISGTNLAVTGGRTDSYAERVKNFDFTQKPDYLVVQLSTNDFSNNIPKGEVGSGTNPADFNKSTLSGAIEYIIAYAKEQCPTCKVVFYAGATKPSWSKRADYENYIYGDFAKICEKWDIQPLDIFHTQYTSYDFFWSDDIHPQAEGYAFGWTPLFVKYFMDRI